MTRSHRLEIRSQSHSYGVLIGRGALADFSAGLQGLSLGKRCAVVTDENVAPLYGERVLGELRRAGFSPCLIVIPAGEGSKSLAEAGRICDAMIREGLDRHAFVVALGGGVVGDLAGFVAAIYYRGVPFIQIPTTVMAQADSSVGGKTGVNAALGKNLIGAFHPPSLVVADVDTLDSLPPRAFNEGFAEVIKHAVIRDRAMFDALAHFHREDDLPAVMRRNLEIKAEIVAADEFELTGQRALLNFGHTVGHAVEQAAGYGLLLHGEAISIGMVAAGRLSMEKAGLSEAEFLQIIERLRAFDLPVSLPGGLSTDHILESLSKDKKFKEGTIRFVLTPALGEAFLSEPGQVTWEDLRQAVEMLR
jgi:3-dehydroquinate synthase